MTVRIDWRTKRALRLDHFDGERRQEQDALLWWKSRGSPEDYVDQQFERQQQRVRR